MTHKIIVPELALVILVGVSGSGKSSFAQKHFRPTEIISSDYCRALISDDENNQSCTRDAFEVLHYIASKRLQAGKLTVIDATNVQVESRKTLVELAKHYHVLPVAIVLNIPPEICLQRNKGRTDRDFGKHVIRNQHNQLMRSLINLKKREGVSHVTILNSPAEIDVVQVERKPMWTNKKHERGPFDIIGDIHGCFDELMQLLKKLGYQIEKTDKYNITHTEGRRIIFVGDLVDRGPKSPEVLRLVMDSIESGIALCVNGNHDDKLKRKLMGRNVNISHGLSETLEQLSVESDEFKVRVLSFLQNLISHYLLDDGKLAVAHAGLKKEYMGRASSTIREFCMYGDTTGEVDGFGLPVRYLWSQEYRGDTLIVYGHTPVAKPEWINNTINIDTGCVFGGKLTALRYPEKELIYIDAAKIYYDPIKPLNYNKQMQQDNILDIETVIGKHVISTQLHHNVTIREQNATAALEVMGRFAVDPHWLIYLPPTMAPTATCQTGDLLEHPAAAFDFYKKCGIRQLICEEKHMGSRAVVVLCQNQDTAQTRFHISNSIGSCYTRTGRSFFSNLDFEHKFLMRIQSAVTRSGLWEKLQTNWICLDVEIMPWSAKALGLLEQQYASVGTAASVALNHVNDLMLRSVQHNIQSLDELHKRYMTRLETVKLYNDIYQKYCWPVQSLDDYKLAPFHILAHENSLNMNKDHLWHLEMINALCQADTKLLQKTTYKIVNTDDEKTINDAVQWWMDITSDGSEGIVVKPLDFTVKTHKGLVQPGIKCRGREYLRIIYGPEYTIPENLERLRARSLRMKQSLALREYALGYEALWHFINKAPLYKVHEAVSGILALESEPIDPRL